MSKFYPKFVPADFEIVCFDDAGTGTPAAGTEGEKKIEMTQAQIDAIVNGRVKLVEAEKNKALDTAKQAVAQLESLKGNIPEDVKAQYESQVDELNKKLLTTEQLKAQELAKKDKEYTGKLETAQADAKKWKAAHDEILIDFGIEKAGATHGALKGMTTLLKAYLKPQTRLVPDKDEQGNIRGYIPTVDFRDAVDEKGQPTVITLPVEQVVGKMKEIEQFFPIFEGTAKGGIGGSNGSGGMKGENPDDMTTEQYVAWQKKHPGQY